MHRRYWLEQCVTRFLELGCPMPVDLEAVIEAEGSRNASLLYRRGESVDVWLDGGEWGATSTASA